jgi:GWxTD domain-containing protein
LDAPSVSAQVDKYVQIASTRRQSPVYYEAFAVPREGEQHLLVVSYKVPFDRLVFMRHHGGDSDKSFRAGLDVLIEIYKDGERIDSKALKDESFAADYESTLDPLKGASGAVTFQLAPGRYGFRLQLTDQNTDRTAASLVRPILVPDFDSGAIGKAIVAANVDESDLFRAVQLANLGGDAHFGKGAVAVIPFTVGPATEEPNISWTLRRLDKRLVEEERRKRSERIRQRARDAEGSVGIKVEEDRMPSMEGGFAIDSGKVAYEEIVALEAAVAVDVLPDKVRLTRAEGDPDYYAAIIDLHAERLENGTYVLDVRLEDSDLPVQSTRFDTHWPDMPYSLFDVDVALDNMEFILGRDELKALKNGSREEKILKFETFWSERDPTPETAYNELMVEYFERIDFAAQEYRTGAGFAPNGLQTDRARVYIVHGPPDDVSRIFPDRGGVLETWKYSSGRTFRFEAASSLEPFFLVDGS